MNIYDILDTAMANLAGFLWGTPLVILLLGGGIFFAAYSRLVPMLYFKHGIDILLGKYDSDDDPAKNAAFESTYGFANAGIAGTDLLNIRLGTVSYTHLTLPTT